jgi:hypothetical protein
VRRRFLAVIVAAGTLTVFPTGTTAAAEQRPAKRIIGHFARKRAERRPVSWLAHNGLLRPDVSTMFVRSGCPLRPFLRNDPPLTVDIGDDNASVVPGGVREVV